MADFEVTTTLRTQTCGDFHHYAVPCAAVYSSVCPICAWNERQERHVASDKKDRVIAALRGALTKARKASRG